ncbi:MULTISPECIES: Wzz/FepE/Etk N-terminal domain-containing protein [Rathayibacter]|uniref:Wzz/FepE/Etk N-terminal domain-containing protein n=1 Tax=Rathayibacter TaxID=33886 RepID=UPI00138F0D58|nr:MULTISPECIES: Wzz/FepE/Etk N-terminal domain-containing protein [Rathayibacter]MCJ1695799.1 Wzz/FepE/Etk N-terminal domain-containing protein [Rathayibacter caricis]
MNGLVAGIWRRWIVIVAFTLIGIIGALIVNAVVLPQYRAEARVYVAVSTTGALSTSDRVAANSAAAQATVTFVALGTSDTVLQGVIDSLGLDETIEDLASRVEVTSELESVVITIAATDPNAEQAAVIANALAAQLDASVQGTETPAVTAQPVPVIQLEVLSQAIPPLIPVTGGPIVLLILGLLAGAVIGVGVAIVLTALDRRIRDGDDVRTALERPLLGVVPSKVAKLGELLASNRIPARYSAVAFELSSIGRARSVSSFALAPATSSTPHITSAVLLAKAIAAVGSSVILVDATADGSALADAAAGRPGLRDVASGTASLDAAVVRRQDDGMDLLPAGGRNAAAAGRPEALRAVIRELEQVYDIVLLITGVVGSTEESIAFRGLADAAVLVLVEGKVEGRQAAADTHWIETAGTPVVGALVVARRRLQKTPAIV